MPGTTFWDGSADTEWTQANNWTTGTGSAPPVGGDEVIFDGRAPATFAPALKMGSDGETGGVDFDLLHVKEGYTQDIGAAGVPLHTSAQRIIIEGSGTYYIEVSEEEGSGPVVPANQNVPTVIVNNPDATLYLTGQSNDGSNFCEVTDLFIIAGTVYVGYDGSSNVSVAVQNIYSAPKNAKASNVTLVISPDVKRQVATAYAMSIYMQTGTVTSDSPAALIEMMNGTFNYGTDLDTSPVADADITQLRLHRGNFHWYPDDDSTPYIQEAYLFGGSFLANGTLNNDRAKELGQGADNNIYMFEGATLNIANKKSNILMDATTYLYNHGGVLTVDDNTGMTWFYDV